MTNPLATMPAAELIRHKLRAAWPASPRFSGLKAPSDLAGKIQASKSILQPPPTSVEAFTGDEPPF